MTRKIMACMILLIAALTVTACWDRREVDKLAIVIGLGVDKIPGTNPILLTVQIVNPSTLQKESGSGGQELPFVVKTAQGKTVYDAVRNFAKASPRSLFFSHNSIIVIGDHMARSGIKDILDYFERDSQFRKTTWILVTPKSANEIMKAKLDLQKLTAIGIKDMINEFHQSTASKVVQRKDFMIDLSGKSSSAVASKIDAIDEEADVQRKLEQAGSGNRDNTSSDQKRFKKKLQLSGTAVFRKDKLAGYFNAAESRGLLWILDEVKGGAVVSPCPNGEKGNVVFLVNQTKRKFKPSFEGEQLKMHLEFDEESIIEEVNCSNLDITKPETIKKLESVQARDIENRILKTIRKAQQYKCDVFKFGEAFYRNNPKKWQKIEGEWGEHFAKMELSVHVASHIRRVGMTTKAVKDW